MTAVVCGVSTAVAVPTLAAPAQARPKPSPGRSVSGVKPTTFRFAKPHDDAKSSYRPTATQLPTAATGALTLAGSKYGRVAGTPVWARPAAKSYAGTAQADVQVLDQAAAERAGVSGVLVKLTPKSGNAGRIKVGVDYGTFAEAYGGNYGSRLQLVQMPECVLTTPAKAECRTRTPLNSANDAKSQAVSADVTLPSAASSSSSAVSRSAAVSTSAVVLAATAGTDSNGGKAGTYSASDLNASGSWAGGGSAGSFGYNYPIAMPPSPSSLIPTVGLSYDSSAVDGQTASTQAQASWIGDGWSIPRSYIEQSFISCKDDPEGTASPSKTDDLCYDGLILTMSMNGASNALVYDKAKSTVVNNKATDVFRAQSDSGEIIQHVYDKSLRYDAGTWQVTTRDGIVYQFGLNKLPGWATGKATTNSVDTVPVYGSHAGDPCYSTSGFDSSSCTMARRWNLDYVTDVHGNAMSYYYKQSTNYYGRNQGKTMDTYVRDSYLDHIDYGFRAGGAYGTVPNKVEFTTGDRCVSGTCQPLNTTNKANWPDVPYDLICVSGATCKSWGPSFFSTVRLTAITTKQYTSSAYQAVDTYAFAQAMPATGDGTSPTLWLSSIVRTGSDTTSGGSSAVTLPPVSFASVKLPNRVAVSDGFPAYYRQRLQSITTETGSVITANYDLPKACPATSGLDPATNTNSCYPVRWTPAGLTDPILDWFNKYAVTRVTATDPTGGAVATSTSYDYMGGAAWHFDNDELVKPKYRTYGQFRGYAKVRTYTGDGVSDRRTMSENTFYRGMSKNNNTTTVNVTDSQGGTHEDLNELAGSVLETTTYQGESGAVDNSTISAYWVSAATATRTRTGLPALTANWIEPVLKLTRQRVTGSGGTTWRYQEADYTYDANISSPTFGVMKTGYSHTVPADPKFDRCATNTFAPTGTASALVGLVSQTETVAVACGGFTQGNPASVPVSPNSLTAPTTVTRPAQVLSQTRTFYDDKTWNTTFPQTSVPTKGEVTMTQTAKDYANSTYTYQTISKKAYDDYGRELQAYDANGNLTKTDFTANTAGLTTGITVTNPLGQTSSTSFSPMRGLVLSGSDLNGVVNSHRYDALGRTTGVWLNNRAVTSPANYKFTYTISNTGITATTTERANDAGGYIKSVTLYDAMQRVRQTQTVTPQGGRMITDNFYDSRGWISATYNGWWDSKTSPTVGAPVSATDLKLNVPSQTFPTYDGLGRPVVVRQSKNNVEVSRTTTIYQGDRTTVVPPTGSTVTTATTDPIGRTNALIEYKVRPSVNIPADTFTGSYSIAQPAATEMITTTYGYDARGDRTTVTDTKNNTWTTAYNLLGQTTSKTDPDAGTTTAMSYDSNGNLLQATDARGKTVSTSYDALNRPTGTYAATTGAQSASNQLTKLVYDNSDNAVTNMTYPKGHLTSATSYNGGQPYKFQARGFNVFGASIAETITIPASEGTLAGDYTVGHQYTTSNGLLLKDVYPAKHDLPAETLVHHYDAFDNPDTLSGVNGYVQGVTEDAYGRVNYQTLGAAPNLANVSSYYDEHTGQLTKQLVTRTPGTPADVDQQDYTYDPTGNLTRQTSTRLASGSIGETQCFAYDELRRLTQAWTATDSCAATPTTTDHTTVGNTIGAGSAYWTTWTFDDLGNRTSQVQHAISSTTDTTTNYTYGAKPHQVTTTTTSGASTGATSYTYDAAGNTITRNPGTGDQTLSWDDNSNLAGAVTNKGSSSNVYGPDGELLLQKDPGTTTLFVGSQQFALNTSTNAVTGTRYYALPGGGSAIRTNGTYTFAIADAHGSPTLYLDSTAQTPTWRMYTPYGDNRGATINIPDNRGFLNKTINSGTGLIHVGAREYDSAIGRFISVDPVQDLSDPQQWNGYAYANNNPASMSDPTGLRGDDQYYGSTGASLKEKNSADAAENSTTGTEINGSGTPKSGVTGGRGHSSEKRSDSCYATCDGQQVLYKKIVLPASMSKEKQDRIIAKFWKGYRYLFCMPSGFCYDDAENLMAYNFTALLKDVCHSEGGCGEAIDKITSLDSLIQAAAADGMFLGAGEQSGAGLGGHSPFFGGKAEAPPARAPMEQPSCNSFTADTPVLMADGTAKPIGSVRVGDKVVATNPETGETSQKAVTKVHDNVDSKFVDLNIIDATGHLETIHTTSEHPFWSESDHEWVNAGSLSIGTYLRSTNKGSAEVASRVIYSGSRHMINLTVADIHTYYVIVGTTPVLVHNAGGSSSPSKGAAGTQMLIDDLTVRGYVIRGTEISFKAANGVKVRFDVVAEKNGVISVYDAKNGPSAGYTENQGKLGGYNSVETNGGTFYGRNARKAGLAGTVLGPTRVNIAGFGGYPHC
ncbi:polymorphic toxin-type HINT domain-containing protein [Actinoplanes sp. NPDC020271]|uniref:polymorphic toxin-type HINT domain-containing protein n=1 Tax=Actinoplanes sp. NPDC020271 TaxID=3363896 RepID=UPI0037A98B5B